MVKKGPTSSQKFVRGNYLVSERIYEYFSKHAGIYEMDENVFDGKVKGVLDEAVQHQVNRLKDGNTEVPAETQAKIEKVQGLSVEFDKLTNSEAVL